MSGMNCTVYTPIISVPVARFSIAPIPTPRKVSQKERRRKERRLRSNGIRVRKGAK